MGTHGTHQTSMQSSLSIKSVPLWYEGLYPGIEETCVKCMQPGGVCCKLLISHFLLKGSKDTEMTRTHTVNVWLVMVLQAEHYGPPSL